MNTVRPKFEARFAAAFIAAVSAIVFEVLRISAVDFTGKMQSLLIAEGYARPIVIAAVLAPTMAVLSIALYAISCRWPGWLGVVLIAVGFLPLSHLLRAFLVSH